MWYESRPYRYHESYFEKTGNCKEIFALEISTLEVILIYFGEAVTETEEEKQKKKNTVEFRNKSRSDR